MKVAIFETEHFEAAYPLIRLFDDGRNEVTIFCYPAVQLQLEHMLKDEAGRYQWVVKKENESRVSFIRTIQKETKKRKIDLLYLNTLSDNYFFYALLVALSPVKRIVLTIHAINSFFTTTNKYNPRRLMNAIGKRMLRAFIKEFTVLSEAMVSPLQQRIGAGKKVYCVPGGIFEKQNQPAPLQDPVHLVIPGSVDGKRRDYTQVFELLQLFQKESIAVRMTFLGRFCGEYGQRIRSQSKEYENLAHYESEEIEQPEFDRVLESADFIFSPSIVNTIIEGVPETYGSTISSGNVSDVIRHAKPFIVPATFTVDSYLEQSCIRYNSLADIVSFVKSVQKNEGDYKKLSELALNSSQLYTIEKVRERNIPR